MVFIIRYQINMLLEANGRWTWKRQLSEQNHDAIAAYKFVPKHMSKLII